MFIGSLTTYGMSLTVVFHRFMVSTGCTTKGFQCTAYFKELQGLKNKNNNFVVQDLFDVFRTFK